MEKRTQRIISTAVELAEQGGFDAVRLRDVATHAGVALGTIYKRFPTKEDILVAALEQEVQAFARLMAATTVRGDTRSERATEFFNMATSTLLARPNFARAVLRAVASGETELIGKVAAFHTTLSHAINQAINGPEVESTQHDNDTAFLFQQIWFANLVGWMGGLHDRDTVMAQMRFAVEQIL